MCCTVTHYQFQHDALDDVFVLSAKDLPHCLPQLPCVLHYNVQSSVSLCDVLATTLIALLLPCPGKTSVDNSGFTRLERWSGKCSEMEASCPIMS